VYGGKKMKTDSRDWFKKDVKILEVSGTVDKQSYVPAYAQLAQILRKGIADGDYPPGSRLPSEAALAKRHGVSAMTARQAVGEIVEEGLVKRVQGSGTFVQKLDVASGSLDLGALRRVLADQGNIQVRIQKTSVERASGDICQALGVPPATSLILVERLILYQDEPFTLQTGFARFEPESPVVEMMLDTTVLTGLFLENKLSSFKKGQLRLLPTSYNDHEALLLGGASGEHAFRLEHVFYDNNDEPAAYGWFLVSPDRMPITGRIGIWGQ
jgi:GntR family transcriptional regulator